jgi:hypothetical protein
MSTVYGICYTKPIHAVTEREGRYRCSLALRLNGGTWEDILSDVSTFNEV